MVTKLLCNRIKYHHSLILAKIHMVTKLELATIQEQLQSYSSKNPYGNKTELQDWNLPIVSYSSKNPYGNKTD